MLQSILWIQVCSNERPHPLFWGILKNFNQHACIIITWSSLYIAWKCFSHEQCGHFLVFLCILIDPFTSSYYQYNASSQMITYFEERYPFQKVFSPEFQLVYGSLLPLSLSAACCGVWGVRSLCGGWTAVCHLHAHNRPLLLLLLLLL